MDAKQALLNTVVGASDKELPLSRLLLPEMNRYIDSTLLKGSTTSSQITDLCESAVKHNFRSVRVPPLFVQQAYDIIKKTYNSQVLIGTVVGFPFGYDSIESKRATMIKAMLDGADECDVVLSHLMKMSGYVFEEVGAYQDIAAKVNVMPIIEVEHFDGQVDKLHGLCQELQGIPFITHIKTSTGINVRPTTLGDILFLKEHNGHRFKIKASGGISTGPMARDLIEAGANIIGTSKADAIMEWFLEEKNRLEQQKVQLLQGSYTIKLQDTTIQ